MHAALHVVWNCSQHFDCTAEDNEWTPGSSGDGEQATPAATSESAAMRTSMCEFAQPRKAGAAALLPHALLPSLGSPSEEQSQRVILHANKLAALAKRLHAAAAL